jgi:TPR repeat protein
MKITKHTVYGALTFETFKLDTSYAKAYLFVMMSCVCVGVLPSDAVSASQPGNDEAHLAASGVVAEGPAIAIQSADVEYEQGMLYYLGHDVEQNYEMARNLFERAAQQRHLAAQFYLAQMWESGWGGPQSEHRALSCYAQAAHNDGHAAAYRSERADAFFYLGSYHEHGRAGLQESSVDALIFYRRAAELGSALANERLDLVRRMKAVGDCLCAIL